MPVRANGTKMIRLSWEAYKIIYDYALEHNITLVEASRMVTRKVKEEKLIKKNPEKKSNQQPESLQLYKIVKIGNEWCFHGKKQDYFYGTKIEAQQKLLYHKKRGG